MKEEILKYDKNFDESMFLSRIDHIFIMVLSAIMDNDMSSVKHYLSDDVYNKFESMVNGYKASNYTRLFDEMNIKESYISDVKIDENFINITCTIVTRYMDYLVDDDGNFVSGVNTHRIEKNHTVIFSKRLDASELKSARRCPSCGHTLDINSSGICPYCKGVFNTEKYDYILSEMELV